MDGHAASYTYSTGFSTVATISITVVGVMDGKLQTRVAFSIDGLQSADGSAEPNRWHPDKPQPAQHHRVFSDESDLLLGLSCKS